MKTTDNTVEEPVVAAPETAQDATMIDGEKVSFAGVVKRFKSFNITKTMSADNIFSNAQFIFFMVGIAVMYIYNTHLMETTTRDMDKVKTELKELRWKYMSAKSSLMFNSKQTEVASAVQAQGLKELREPPKKILITEGEY